MSKEEQESRSMSETEYANSLNSGSRYRNDLKMAASYDIQTFDPMTLAEIPGNLSLTSMTGAGKTWLIIDWLSIIHKEFDSIYVFSRTAKIQSCYNFLPRDSIFETFNESFIEKLFLQHKNKKKANIDAKLPKVLIIFDDIVNDPEYKRGSLAFDNLYTEGRHYNFTTWFLTQKFTLLKPLQRTNVRWAAAFDLDRKREREYFCQDYLSTHNNQVGELLFKRIVKEKKYQAVIVEVYKNGASTEEKVKKYIAPKDCPKFKIKENPPLVTREMSTLTDLVIRTRKGGVKSEIVDIPPQPDETSQPLLIRTRARTRKNI